MGRAGKKAQGLKELDTLAKDPGSIPKTDIAAHTVTPGAGD